MRGTCGHVYSSEHYPGLSAEAIKLDLIVDNYLKSNVASWFRS